MSINRTTFLLVAFGLLSPVCCSKWMMNSSLAQETESYALYSYLYRNSNWLVPEEEVAIATQPFAFDHIPASESCLKPATEEERVIVQAAKWLSTQSFAWTRQRSGLPKNWRQMDTGPEELREVLLGILRTAARKMFR